MNPKSNKSTKKVNESEKILSDIIRAQVYKIFKTGYEPSELHLGKKAFLILQPILPIGNQDYSIAVLANKRTLKFHRFNLKIYHPPDVPDDYVKVFAGESRTTFGELNFSQIKENYKFIYRHLTLFAK
jgi:hypothetical protein